MSKTRRNYAEEYDIDDYRQNRKEKRIARALKTRDLDDLISLEDEEF